MNTLLLRIVALILVLSWVPALVQGQDGARFGNGWGSGSQAQSEIESEIGSGDRPPESGTAEVGTAIGKDGTGKIRVEVQGALPEPPLFYSIDIHDRIAIDPSRILHRAEVGVRLLQGQSPTVRLAIRGAAEVTGVQGESLASWSVGQEGNQRFLDIQIPAGATGMHRFEIRLRSEELELPATQDITHFAPTEETAGFNQRLTLGYAPGVEGRVAALEGFVRLETPSVGGELPTEHVPIDELPRGEDLPQQVQIQAPAPAPAPEPAPEQDPIRPVPERPGSADDLADRFHTSTGGLLRLLLTRSGAAAGPVELVATTLTGRIHPDGRWADFSLRGRARVTEDEAELPVLSGRAAAGKIPQEAGYRLALAQTDGGEPFYVLVFPRPGAYEVALDFVAAIASDEAWKSLRFTLGAGAVAPLELAGLAPETEFRAGTAGTSVVPAPDGQAWRGFVPASGRVDLVWKDAPRVDEGALFFTTSAQIEATLGAGLLRQDHAIAYRVLQGKLSTLALAIAGPGEVLDVKGGGVAAWTLVGDLGDGAADAGETPAGSPGRTLRIELGQAIEHEGLITVRTQTPLDAFPVRVEATRLLPVGAVRHSGFIRLSNRGSVRLEPTGVSGLTQLAPDQFPGAPAAARQVFVYRFPSPEYGLAVAADRIQPEVDVSQRVIYRQGEGDRTIAADIELDIREAPIREMDILVPADYSVVSVQGVGVADYVVGSELVEGNGGTAPPGAGPEEVRQTGPDKAAQTGGATGPANDQRKDPGDERQAAPADLPPRRNLKVIFERDLSGRQLLRLQLEQNLEQIGEQIGEQNREQNGATRSAKNEQPPAGDWVLPRLGFPDAKSVRGDVGIAAVPGFRIAVGATDLLIEKPLAYFPVQTPYLQQAFRIRDPDWSATLTVERLPKSVQADVFHLYSLTEGAAFGSALVNYFVTGAPVSELALAVPADLDNLVVDGQDVRTWRREGDTLRVSLHQPVIGAYTLLLTYEERLGAGQGTLDAGRVAPLEVAGESGYVQVVSPMQVKTEPRRVSDTLLALDPMELPAELRLLSAAPSLGVWQYTERPFDLALAVGWFEPGTTLSQVVEFAQAKSRLSADGELVTDLIYDVKTRGSRVLALRLPADARLWTVRVDGASVTARQAGDSTLVPLPGAADPNQGVAVALRLGTPAQAATPRTLALPVVAAPVLKTRWQVFGEEDQVLVPVDGELLPGPAVLRPVGFAWIAGPGLGALTLIAVLTAAGASLASRRASLGLLGLLLLLLAVAASLVTAGAAFRDTVPPAPLTLDLPVLMPDEGVSLLVRGVPRWMADVSWAGLLVGLAGIGGLFFGSAAQPAHRGRYRIGGALLLAVGLLLQRDAAHWFLLLLALALFVLLFLPEALAWLRDRRTRLGEKREARRLRRARRERREQAQPEESQRGASGDESPPLDPGAGLEDSGPRGSGPGTGAGTRSLVVGGLLALGGLLGGLCLDTARAEGVIPDGFAAADAIHQEWQIRHEDGRLDAGGRIRLTGRPGDRFLLLRPPAVLTGFEGRGLRIGKQEVPGIGLCYVVAVPLEPEPLEPGRTNAGGDRSPSPAADATPAGLPNSRAETPLTAYEATFAYRLEVPDLAAGFTLPTGPAAVQEIRATYDQGGWELASAAAVKVEPLPADGDDEVSRATLLLGPVPGAPARISLAPRTRDLSEEATRFFVEAANLYIPAPGAVDGRHRIWVRPSQGQVKALRVRVPAGLTISEVRGPVASWQFDADRRDLRIAVEPVQSQAFDLFVDTQGGLDPLPANVRLAPLRVVDTAGEVGLVALAFGPDAQPEKVTADGLSAVNPGDFDAGLLPTDQAALHRVYRYGSEDGSLALRVAPVAPEVRVTSKQVVSIGDERLVIAVNFVAEITRAGLFQLGFPLPAGLEVESLSGDALHHWAELADDDERRIILHLNGKTLGAQAFSLTLSGPAPDFGGTWEVPRFALDEAARQTGELVARPTTGIRLRTLARQQISEIDPRTLDPAAAVQGEAAKGALAFRLLQRDWSLVLGIDKLDPWITGQVLHEVTLREGQTRHALMASFKVENASIRALPVRLPVADEAEIKTLRASGDAVSDLVRTTGGTGAQGDEWELRFKRRVVGDVAVRIEYERRGERANDVETLSRAAFPAVRQLAYYLAVRAGARLELTPGDLPRGWQGTDWNAVPQELRDLAGQGAPVLTLRTRGAEETGPGERLDIRVRRHLAADALKLRVTGGSLTTVLSPFGDQLTAVDLALDVIQRSSLTVGLPAAQHGPQATPAELYSIFVNGESVHAVRRDDALQFSVLPGTDDGTAHLRLVYTLPGDSRRRLALMSPRLGVPLENIEWRIVVPRGFRLADADGDLEPAGGFDLPLYDRQAYLAKAGRQRQERAQQATDLLEKANQDLQAGEQTRAWWALKSVANQQALDAASNEDARVQLENLQTQQAIVGLNTRRQRLYLDNFLGEGGLERNEEMVQGASLNRVLQQGDLNFRPQEMSQLLQGNTSEDNAVLRRIATRLVKHQRTTEPAPQAIDVIRPEEGRLYRFRRPLQVAEDKPLGLLVRLTPEHRLAPWRILLVAAALLVLAAAIARPPRRKAE